jgi:hypothetical protein
VSKKPVTVALVTIGLGLLGFSGLWPHLVSHENYWGDEEQAAFSQAMSHAHELEMRSSSGKRQSTADKEAQQRELTAAQAHWESQRLKLEQAKLASQRPGNLCFWAGLAATLCGVLAYRFLK